MYRELPHRWTWKQLAGHLVLKGSVLFLYWFKVQIVDLQCSIWIVCSGAVLHVCPSHLQANSCSGSSLLLRQPRWDCAGHYWFLIIQTAVICSVNWNSRLKFLSVEWHCPWRLVFWPAGLRPWRSYTPVVGRCSSQPTSASTALPAVSCRVARHPAICHRLIDPASCAVAVPVGQEAEDRAQQSFGHLLPRAGGGVCGLPGRRCPAVSSGDCSAPPWSAGNTHHHRRHRRHGRSGKWQQRTCSSRQHSVRRLLRLHPLDPPQGGRGWVLPRVWSSGGAVHTARSAAGCNQDLAETAAAGGTV